VLKKLPVANEVELVVISPMVRTLQTAEIGLGWLLEKGVGVGCDARWQGESIRGFLWSF
jgi:phosphohistidine phosphatase SixA